MNPEDARYAIDRKAIAAEQHPPKVGVRLADAILEEVAARQAPLKPHVHPIPKGKVPR